MKGEWTDDGPLVTQAHVTSNLYSILSRGTTKSDYWASIQSCDLTTAPQIQNAVKSASDANTLFKLTNGQRLRLQQ